MSSNNEREQRLEKLSLHFPITMRKLMATKEFVLVSRQMQMQGYLDWEIMQAACNLVVRHRIDPQDAASPQKVATAVEQYMHEYKETEDSPFPPPDFFSKKSLRGQVLMDRGARMARFAKPPVGAVTSESELQHTVPEPGNLIYSKSQDGFHGWAVSFYELVPETKPVRETHVQIISDANEVSFEAAETLARDLALDAGLVWDFFQNSGIKNREPVVVSVYAESQFALKFPRVHEMLRRDNQLTERLPVAGGAGRKKNGTLGVRIVLRDDAFELKDRSSIGKLVLQFAVFGILHLLSGIEKPEALQMATEFVRKL